MLSNPPPSLQQRQRLHRRQNSTPTTPYEAMKVPNMPTPGFQRHNSHRRGLSLDQRSPVRRPRSMYESVSITNKGSAVIEQQILREAQQQRITRPGQQFQEPDAPQCGTPNETTNNGVYPMAMHTDMYPHHHLVNGHLQSPRDAHFDMSRMALHHVADIPMDEGYEGIGLGLDENAGQHYFQQAHQVVYDVPNNMAIDMRRMSQPDLQSYGQRPITPIQNLHNARLPLTPATTPFNRIKLQGQYPRTTQSSPTKPQFGTFATSSQPMSMQRGRSLQSIYEGDATHTDLPSPPGTAPLASSSTFDVAMMPTPGVGSLDDLNKDPFDADPKKPQPEISARESSPSAASIQSSPSMSQDAGFDDGGRIGRSRAVPRMLPASQTLPNLSGSSSPVRAALSPRRMSISDLNLEPGISASINETDITLDDIAQYIEGPDTEDNKWICKFDDCNKRFGRKENIKSHVQTHLGDRQFKCDHCGKCFVRGHDLKRHAKIHSGAKPYPCLCGNAFARHDALTRHRQRGMCIGAFDGIVKKVIKRGRPRKHRPDMDERLDKASRTRERMDRKENHHYASSISDSSISSYQSPPTETFESLSIRGSSPFEDMAFFSSQPTDSVALPPDLFTFTPPASPGYSTGNKPSPAHGPLTPQDLASIPKIPSSPPQAVRAGAVAHHSPPSLCHSSSPAPISTETNIYDFVQGIEQVAETSDMAMKDLERTEFDSFFDYGAAIPEHDDFFGQL